jgi:hypothetical protein
MFVCFHQYRIVQGLMMLDIGMNPSLNYMKQERHIHLYKLMNSSLVCRHYLYCEHFRIFVSYPLKIFISYIFLHCFKHHTSDWISKTTSTFIRAWCISAIGVNITRTTRRIETFIDVNTWTIDGLNNIYYTFTNEKIFQTW